LAAIANAALSVSPAIGAPIGELRRASGTGGTDGKLACPSIGLEVAVAAIWGGAEGVTEAWGTGGERKDDDAGGASGGAVMVGVTAIEGWAGSGGEGT